MLVALSESLSCSLSLFFPLLSIAAADFLLRRKKVAISFGRDVQKRKEKERERAKKR
jgi:hypothetical protein